jgi:hypothetical protein
MTVLFYVALAFFVTLGFLLDLGFYSVVARVGRGVLRLITFGRVQVDDTGDWSADIVVGTLTIIAFFLLVLSLSAML